MKEVSMFIKVMATISGSAFGAAILWMIYVLFAEGHTNNVIIPLLITGLFSAIFVPWYQAIKDETESRVISEAMTVRFRDILDETESSTKK